MNHFFLQINNFVAKSLAEEMNRTSSPSYFTEPLPPLFTLDSYILRSLSSLIFKQETRNSGLNLTHAQDSKFIQVRYSLCSSIIYVA